MNSKKPTRRVGIEERTDATGRKQYRGHVYDRRARRKLRGEWTYSLAAAKSWRHDALARLDAGTLSADRGDLIATAADAFVAEMKAGIARTRSGDRYKPSAIRDYDEGSGCGSCRRSAPHGWPMCAPPTYSGSSPAGRPRGSALDDPQHGQRAPRALPALGRARPLPSQPDAWAHAARRARQARPDRAARCRRAADRRAAVPRAGDLGDRVRGRAAARRAASGRLGARPPRRPHDPRALGLGPVRGPRSTRRAPRAGAPSR